MLRSKSRRSGEGGGGAAILNHKNLSVVGNKHSCSARFVLHWLRSRPLFARMMLFLLAVLTVTSALLLLGALFFGSTSIAATQQGIAPPPRYKDVDENAEIVPFRRPTMEDGSPLTPQAPSTTEAPAVPPASALFFQSQVKPGDPLTAKGTHDVYRSAGIARVVLTTPSFETGLVSTAAPQLLAPDMSWAAYERYQQARADAGDAKAATGLREGLHGPSETHIAPVTKVEVQLLRQRVSRQVWATPEHDASVIVGIAPLESAVLSTAEELLVERYLRAVDRWNPQPDAAQYVPMEAVRVEGTARDGGIRSRKAGSVRMDAAMRFSRKLHTAKATGAASEGKEAAATAPLVELRSAKRPTIVDNATAHTKVAPTVTMLTWRADDNAAANPATVDITLDVVHPRRATSPQTGQPQYRTDDTFTDALEATFCSERLVRLYGISSHLFSSRNSSSDGGGAAAATWRRNGFMDAKEKARNARDAADGIDSIPLDMVEDAEIMVGGHVSSSSPTRTAGIVPLLYLELETHSQVVTLGADSGGGDGVRLGNGAARRTVGLLWLHPAPFHLTTFTAASPDDWTATRSCVRLRSTAGSTRLFMLPGPTPADVLRQYYTLTGFPTLPPRSLLGYHHGAQASTTSTQANVECLSDAFLHAQVPLDSVWATHSAVAAKGTPFTWNSSRFADLFTLQSNLWYRGRRYVVTRGVSTVPITTRSPLFIEGRRQGFFVTLNAEEAAGWPTHSIDGMPSHVVDFTNPSARRWYGNMLKYRRFVGSTNHTFIDLQHAAPCVRYAGNEAGEPGKAGVDGLTPALACALREQQRFGAVLPMDVGHYDGFAHRQVHQLLPVQFARATHEGMLRRTQYIRRALVFTENFYAGVQRYAIVRVEAQPDCLPASAVERSATANAAAQMQAAWEQLHHAVRQCTQLGILGVPFSGVNLGSAFTAEFVQLLWQSIHQGGQMGNGNGAQKQQQQQGLSSVTTPSEAEQLMVRWYQAGVFLAAMYSVESTALLAHLDSSHTTSSSASVGPWWMRLPLHEQTREALCTNVKVRYALLPYLYTAAFHASNSGAPFVVPTTFLRPTAADDWRTEQTGAAAREAPTPTCYAVGTALVTCPLTKKEHVRRAADGGVFNLWTGTWHAESALMESARAATPLSWLATASLVPASEKTLGHEAPQAGFFASDFLAPVFIRPGTIVSTQNTLEASSAPRPSTTTAATHTSNQDASYVGVHSTHHGANWTLTIALPPLPPKPTAVSIPTKPQLVAGGEVFWDEGSHNSQQQPPAPPANAVPLRLPIIPKEVHHCKLRIQCFYEANNAATRFTDAPFRLAVEVHQTSESCAEALAELQSHWSEVPEGFAERLDRAKERRAARLHAAEVEEDAKAEKGRRVARNGRGAGATGQQQQLQEQAFTSEDLRGLHIPRDVEETARNALWNNFLLHRLRFLFQSADDVAKLTANAQADTTGAVVAVERSRVTGEAKDDVTRGKATVVQSRHAHEVKVELATFRGTDGEELSSTSVFGVTRVVDQSGTAAADVPATHMWRLVIPLA